MILIVDDSSDMRDLLTWALSDDGFLVKSASDGREALKMIDCENLPSLIFLDAKMDVMDGQEFLKALEIQCQSENFKKMSVVVISGTEEPLQSPLITKTLKKPLDLDELRHIASRYAIRKTQPLHP